MTDAAELVKLAGCPFCGRTPAMTSIRDVAYVIHCDNNACDVKCETLEDTPEAVVATWNRRAAQQDGAEVEALKHDIERHLAITSEQAAEIERLTSLLVTCANELNRYEQ